MEMRGCVGFLCGLFMFSILSVLVAPGSVRAGELSFHPSVAISEEFTDNIYESRSEKRTDFVTRLLPGLTFKYVAPLWDWDIAYNLDYRYYARNSRSDETTHNLAAKGHIKIIDELFFLDVSDTYKRVSLDISRDYTQEGLYSNQSDSNTFTASPYFVLHPGMQTTVKTGYRYTNVWYREPDAIDKQEHTGFVDVIYEFSPQFSLTGGYAYTRQESTSAYDRHAPYAGVRYEYADNSFIFAQGGYTWITYRQDGRGEFNNPFWNAGISHTMGVYVLTASAAVSYPEDPLTGVTQEQTFAFAVARPIDRGDISGSLYYSTFDGSGVDRTKKLGGGITAKYNLTEKLSGRLAANLERYEYRTASGHTTRIYIAPGVSYSLPWETSLSLSYAHITYDSSARFDENYSVNRVILEARKTF
jgi:hypothetical protein